MKIVINVIKYQTLLRGKTKLITSLIKKPYILISPDYTILSTFNKGISIIGGFIQGFLTKHNKTACDSI